MISKVGYFIYGFFFVPRFAGNYDLGAFLAHLFEYLVNSLFKEVCGVGAFLFFGLASAYQLHKPLC